MFTGILRGSHRFFLQYLWKRAVRITEKPYSYHRGFPAICKYYRVSPQHTQSFPLRSKYRVSLWFLQPFSIDIAEKTYGNPVNPCKHLQCILKVVVKQFLEFSSINIKKTVSKKFYFEFEFKINFDPLCFYAARCCTLVFFPTLSFPALCT